MPQLRINGTRLYYQVHGAGAPVLGIHGTPSSALLWEEPAVRLGRHYRCIVYDRRGFFRSGRPEPFEAIDLTDHVADAVALLEALSATPAVVIGRSTGGLIALELARRHPEAVTALVLLEPAVFTLDPQATAWAQQLRRTVLATAAVAPSTASEAVFRNALGDAAWESLPQQLRDHFAAAGPAVLAEIRGRGLDLSQEPLELTDEELTGISQPTLVVTAQDSPEVLHAITGRLAALLPGAETALVPGGHLIDPAGPAVLDFLHRHVPAPPEASV